MKNASLIVQCTTLLLIGIGMFWIDAQLKSVRDIAQSAATASEAVVEIMRVDPDQVLALSEKTGEGIGIASDSIATGIDRIRDALKSNKE